MKLWYWFIHVLYLVSVRQDAENVESEAMLISGDVIGIIRQQVQWNGCRRWRVYIYGIPGEYNLIVKYDLINGITSFAGEKAEKANTNLQCLSNGALGSDSCLYALTQRGQVLKIDTTNNSRGIVGNIIDSDCNQCFQGWGDAILGVDGCIYCPPQGATRILKYDPHTDLTSLFGCDFGTQICKWLSGDLTTDDVIYCIPFSGKRVLTIDPWVNFWRQQRQTWRIIQRHLDSFFKE